MTESLSTVSTIALIVAELAIATAASAHAILNKRDVRAAIGWVGLVWLVPFVGAALYAFFGVNRIRRRASFLRSAVERPAGAPPASGPGILDALPEPARHLGAIGAIGDSMALAPITPGNAIRPLAGGAAAYAEMIGAIDNARRTVGLATYIFDDDEAGTAFAAALQRATARGVAVRVLIDAVGARYGRPRITRRLGRLGIPVAEFLPTVLPIRMAYAQLRNHRKILVVDGRIGFTGGMNIRAGHLGVDTGRGAIQDVQFRLEGPVVQHLAQTFAEDWGFAAGETLDGDGWFPAVGPADGALARGIASGPDEAVERLRWTLIGALSLARRRVRVVTPYFVPDQMLVTALVLAAMRGVAVEIALPARNNLRLVQWASRPPVEELVGLGCAVWLTPPPFDHSKLTTVDGAWTLLGSANWDQRSLRLNFEQDVEVYDVGLADAVDALIDDKLARSRRLDADDFAAGGLVRRLRDGAAWLLSPYL